MESIRETHQYKTLNYTLQTEHTICLHVIKQYEGNRIKVAREGFSQAH